VSSDTPLVSIIVVNYNGDRYIGDCLDSLVNQTWANKEIIVVDNCSVDTSLSLLESQYRNCITLVKNADNFGFAKGNNCGIVISKGRYIATLNSDACAEKTWLEEMVFAIKADENIGMVASKIMLHNNRNSIDSVGVNIYPDCMSRQRGHLEIDSNKYSVVEEILLPSACAALYRRSMLDEIGLFDEDFFMYCEDTDLGLRGRMHGWKAVLAPQAIVQHRYSASAGKVSQLKAFYVERNHFWVAFKILPVSMLFRLPFYSIFRFAAQCLNMLFFSGKSLKAKQKTDTIGIAFSVLRAYFSMLYGIPAVIGKRKKIWNYKKISSKEIRGLFKKYKLSVSQLFLDPL